MLLALRTPHKPAPRLAPSLARIAKAAADWPRRMIERRRLMLTMAGLSDHELSDIGLSRTDVSDAMATHFAEDPSTLFVARREERRRRSQLGV